jgi:Immunity protein Imm1
LRSDRSIATFERADAEPPYLIIQGGEGGGPDPVFYVEGEWSEFPAAATIPADLARQDMGEFLESGSAPASVDWTET